jgi:hypothetical protein
MNSAFTERFGGVGRLFGREGLARLQAAHVCVVGVGGVGSWVVEALARSGIGALTLIDLDDVCVTNVNRQLPALDGAIGRTKVDVLAERVKLINPECRVTALTEFFTAASAERILSERFDFVVDAIDDVANKARLIAESLQRNLPVITVGERVANAMPPRSKPATLAMRGVMNCCGSCGGSCGAITGFRPARRKGKCISGCAAFGRAKCRSFRGRMAPARPNRNQVAISSWIAKAVSARGYLSPAPLVSRRQVKWCG